MARRIAVIQGHPDPSGQRFGHALAAAYIDGARQAGHEVKLIDVAHVPFPVLRTKEDFDQERPPESIRQVQSIINWADHLVIFYPLWLGTMPALLKAFFEQVFRPGFATQPTQGKTWKRLTGKSARIVVTMGMPAFFYRWYFGAHGLKGLEQNILGFCGIGPIKESLIGMVEENGGRHAKWLERMRSLGRAGK